MRASRTLMVVNSVYQLLTAVNIRRELLAGDSVDLVVTDAAESLKKCVSRLRELGLFQRVLRGKTSQLNREYAGAAGEKLDYCFSRRESLLRFCLDGELEEYETVYFSNFDIFIRLLACRPWKRDCAFICYEDGFSTYVVNYLREGRAPVNSHPEGRRLAERVREVLLYEPRLAMRGDGLPNRPLPPLRRDNRELVELLNQIFDYRRPKQQADFIFLEQSFRAEGIRTNDLELMKECRDAVGQGRFLVKPHPRNQENLPFQLGLSRRYELEAPWELFLLNEVNPRLTLLTVCSNAALTGRLAMGLRLNTVMLYRLFEGKVLWKEDPVLERYLRRFESQFAGDRYWAPRTVYELRAVLKYLGGRHG